MRNRRLEISGFPRRDFLKFVIVIMDKRRLPPINTAFRRCYVKKVPKNTAGRGASANSDFGFNSWIE